MPTPEHRYGRHPFELFVLVFGLAAGIALLINGPPPGSTEELLGPVLVTVWGVMFSGGCAIALVGVLWSPVARLLKRNYHQGTGLLAEQVGLVAVGFGTVIYAVGLLLLDVPLAGKIFPIALIFALGCASFWRAHQINLWIKAAIRQQQQDR